MLLTRCRPSWRLYWCIVMQPSRATIWITGNLYIQSIYMSVWVAAVNYTQWNQHSYGSFLGGGAWCLPDNRRSDCALVSRTEGEAWSLPDNRRSDCALVSKDAKLWSLPDNQRRNMRSFLGGGAWYLPVNERIFYRGLIPNSCLSVSSLQVLVPSSNSCFCWTIHTDVARFVSTNISFKYLTRQ